MFKIIVNNKPVQLLQKVESLTSLVVQHMPGMPLPMEKKLTKPVAEWLYNLTQLADVIEYNGVLMQKEDVTKPAHMK